MIQKRSGFKAKGRGDHLITREEARGVEARLATRTLVRDGRVVGSRRLFGNGWKQIVAKIARAAAEGKGVELSGAGAQMVASALGRPAGSALTRVSGKSGTVTVPADVSHPQTKQGSGLRGVPALVSHPRRRRLPMAKRRVIVGFLLEAKLGFREIGRRTGVSLRVVQYWRRRVRGVSSIEDVDFADRPPGPLAPWNATDMEIEAAVVRVHGELWVTGGNRGAKTVHARMVAEALGSEQKRALPVPSVRTIARILARTGGRRE